MPILLALILMVAAAMPWLRSLESQRRSLAPSATTVPPPEQVAIQATSAGSTQGVGSPRDAASVQQSVPLSVAANPLAAQERGEDLRHANGVSGKDETASGSPVNPENNRLASVSQTSSKSSATGPLPDSSQATPPKPQDLLDSAVRSVESRQFISARIKQQGELIGHQITGEGRYYELRGPIPRIHLELTVEVGSISTSLVQVCTGATFWTYQRSPSGESLSKIDAYRAIAALESARGKVPPAAFASTPGLGGLGRLMRGLNAQFEFNSVVADQLRGLPVWKVSGGWKPAILARLLPEQHEAIEKGRSLDLTGLRGHLPDTVVLFLSQEDCFPYRIDYLRSMPRSSPRRLMGLEFWSLDFNGPIDSGQFIFTPGSLEIKDRTEEFLRSIGEGG